jgi:signal transduction histidine kinase
VWIALGSNLASFANGKFTNYPIEHLRPLVTVRTVYEDPHNRLFIAGLGGLVERRGDGFVTVFGPKEMGEQTVSVLTEDSRGSLWLAGGRGILRRTPQGKMRLFDTRDGLPNRRVRDLKLDRNGNVWVGTSGGLSRLEGDRFVTTPFDGSHDLDVRCFLEDREGNLWVGTNNGLIRFRDDRFTMYGRTEGLPSDQPIAVYQDRRGPMWVGYHNSGLVEFRDQGYHVYTTQDGLGSNEVFTIREARNGDLLVSTRDGLSRMHDGHFSNFALPVPLAQRQVYDALEDDQGSVWLAAPGGVFRLTADGFKNVVPGGGPLQIDNAGMLSKGLDGSIWAGTIGAGFWRIKNGYIRRLSSANGLGGDQVRSLYQDPDGTLWIGTLDGGLNAYRDGKFVVYTAKNGLPSDNVSHIDDDRNGSLWLSTTHGISRVSKQQLRDFAAGRIQTLTPVNYGIGDGLRSAQCAPGYPVGGGGTRSADGRLWFPTTNGLAMLDPAAISEGPPGPEPLVHFLDVIVDGKNVGTGTRINPGPENIQFRYAGIHLGAPERVAYDYKLEGLDADWISAGSRRIINFNTLGKGHYRFVVRASVRGGASSEAAFSFIVLPHYYETAWFLWLCTAIFLVAIYGVYLLRLRQIHNRFSLVLEERARMAREIHDTLAQGFFGISSQLDALELKMSDDGDPSSRKKDLTRRLNLAQRMARHSLTEARRSVMELRASELTDSDLPSALKAAVHHWAAGNSAAVEVQITGAHPDLPEDVEQNVLRIAQEAVTNALKHAAAKTVWVDLYLDRQALQLMVRDDGRGFEPSGVFVLVGGHFGLLGMRERAERLGGSLDVSSEPGVGTEVRVSVPLASQNGRKGARWRVWSLMRTPARQADS